MTEESKLPTTFFETDKNGTIHEIDMISGEVVRSSKTYAQALTGEGSALSTWKYSQRVAEVICQLVATGSTYKKITEMEGMPSYNVLAMWRAQNPEFEEALDAARKLRADHFHDMIVEDLHDDHHAEKDEVAARKLKMDRLKYLASVNNPDKYGNKTKVSGDSEQPLQIVVSTGITRE